MGKALREVAIHRVPKTNRVVIFFINFAVLLLVYGRLLQPHYSPDFFAVHVNGASELPHHIRNGRIIYGLVLCAVEYMGLSVTVYATAFTLVFMCVVSYCIMRVSTVLCNAVDCNDIIANAVVSLALLLGVVNISITEWFLFVECMLMYSLALFFSTIGALAYAKQQSSLLKKVLLSFVAVFISVNCYQAALSWYFSLSLVFILLQTKFRLTKTTVVECVAAMGVAGVNSILNQLIVHIAASSDFVGYLGRHATFAIGDILANVVKSIPIQIRFLYSGFSLMPRFFIFAAFCLGAAMVCISFYTEFGNKAWLQKLTVFVLIMGICYVFVYLPHFVSSNMEISPRSIIGVFMLLGLLFAFAFLWGTKPLRWIVLICTVGVLIVTSLNISTIIDDHLLTSQRDLAEAQAIVCEIESYERESGETVENVCILTDIQPTHYYSNVTTGLKGMNMRQMFIDWEQVNILTAISDKSFVHTYVSEAEAATLVQGRNWDELNLKEQLIFDESTLYIIVY